MIYTHLDLATLEEEKAFDFQYDFQSSLTKCTAIYCLFLDLRKDGEEEISFKELGRYKVV